MTTILSSVILSYWNNTIKLVRTYECNPIHLRFKYMEFYHSQLVAKVEFFLREIQSELVVEINKGIFSFKALKLKSGKINFCAPLKYGKVMYKLNYLLCQYISIMTLSYQHTLFETYLF